MPRAPKPCGIQGCTTIVPNGQRCADHSSGWKTSPRTASSARTSTTHWKQQRAKALQRDNHQCVIRGPRCTTHATQVDHIKPVHLGGTDQLPNLASTCPPCHTSKTAQEAAAARSR
jgi:5-methylcytosine-specific restriction protein A